MEPMVVMAANAAKKVGHEILRAHQNRHRLDLAVESKGLDGLVTQIDLHSKKAIPIIRIWVKNLAYKRVRVMMLIGVG